MDPVLPVLDSKPDLAQVLEQLAAQMQSVEQTSGRTEVWQLFDNDLLKFPVRANMIRRLRILSVSFLFIAARSPGADAQGVVARSDYRAGDNRSLDLERQQRLTLEAVQNDWANLAKYRDANAKLAAPASNENRVVFYGNSITEGWAQFFPAMFPGKSYIGRGISGQTTPQLLVRFRQDVVALKPKVVVILAGTNDIAGNTGPSTLEMIEDNLRSMTEIAKANGIRVVLSSVLPVYDYAWRPGLEPAPKIMALNAWMKGYAAKAGAVYLDYHSAMADARQGLRGELSNDGVHPTEAGYRVMAPLVEKAVAEALRR